MNFERAEFYQVKKAAFVNKILNDFKINEETSYLDDPWSFMTLAQR